MGKMWALVLLLPLQVWAAEKAIIVGGGAAGLYALDKLKDAVLLEQNARPGGRLFSRPATGSLGLTLDEGANLINSNDKVTLSLLKRFRIPYVRRQPEGAHGMAYMIEGKIYTQEEADRLLFRTNARPLWRMAHDQRTRREDYFTATSIDKYLREVDADQTLTQLIRSFFWSEYGREIEELNVNVFFDYISIDADKKELRFIPYYDEAFTVPGGAGQITDRLAKRNRSRIRFEHRVTRIEQAGKDGIFRVYANTPTGEVVLESEKLIFAAPLHTLNEIEVDVPGLTPEILEEAAGTTYARGVKLHLKFGPGFRELYKFRGILTTDTGEQIWTSHQGQSGEGGLLTVLTGPILGGPPAQEARVKRVLKQLETFAPGLTKLHVGTERSEAPFSYSGALRPGESKTLRINESLNPRWITIGEASGGAFQGYLEGAFSSSDEAVKRLIPREKYLSAVCSDLVI